MEVGPWRWDGKSEQDFWVKPGGWDEYTTVVYGQFSTMVNLPFYLMFEQSGSACGHWFLICEHGSLCAHYRHCGFFYFRETLNQTKPTSLGSATVDRVSEELL
jgi:hypothetical protein